MKARIAQGFAFLLSIAMGACAAPAEETADPTMAEGELNTSSDANSLFDLPFYFSVNIDSMTKMTKAERRHPYATFWNPAKNGGESTGLRVIAVPDTDAELGRMSTTLAAAGIMQQGDVLLTFRPELANTIPYAHLQMGTTHAGLVRILSNGKANGVDQPLDSDHNGPNSAPFTSRHYKDAPAFHIVRPRAMRDAQMKKNLDFWMGKAQALIDQPGRPGFNDNYLAPATSHPKFGKDPAKLALAIGAGLLKGDVRSALAIDMNPNSPNEQQLFCSEMAYHLLTLAHCTEADIRGASADQAPACLQQRPFEQLPFAGSNEPTGLGEGPLMVALKDPAALVPQLGQVFCQGVDCNQGNLSAGHLAANAQLVQMKVPEALGLVYQTRAASPNASLPAPAAPLASAIPANYSPTSFLIESLRDEDSRAVDYVATVVFVNPAQAEKASTLSKKPTPRTESAQ